MQLAHAIALLEKLLGGSRVYLAEGIALETEPNFINMQFQRDLDGLIRVCFTEPRPILCRKHPTWGEVRSIIRKVEIVGESAEAYLSTGETLTFSMT